MKMHKKANEKLKVHFQLVSLRLNYRNIKQSFLFFSFAFSASLFACGTRSRCTLPTAQSTRRQRTTIYLCLRPRPAHPCRVMCSLLILIAQHFSQLQQRLHACQPLYLYVCGCGCACTLILCSTLLGAFALFATLNSLLNRLIQKFIAFPSVLPYSAREMAPDTKVFKRFASSCSCSSVGLQSLYCLDFASFLLPHLPSRLLYKWTSVHKADNVGLQNARQDIKTPVKNVL